MAQEPFQKAVLTPTAHGIIADRVVSGSPIPTISYFIPVCDESVLEKTGDTLTGVTLPTSTALNFDPDNPANNLATIASTRLIDNTDPENPVDFKGFFDPEDITRTLANGTNPASLRIRIKKEVNEYAIGGNAHVFYICDENHDVWITIHISPHSFTAGQKWEIITDTSISNPAMVEHLEIIESNFDFTMASEVLLPRIIIGTDEDKASGKAGYTSADFENSDTPITIDNQRIIFLNNVAPLTKDVNKTANNLEFAMETPGTVLPLANRTLSLTGDNVRGHLRVSGALDNSIALSGTRYNLTINSDNDNCVDASGATGLIVLNGRYVGTPEVPTAENGNSSNQIASTEFVQNQLAFYDVLRLKGSVDATSNPEYPAANAGDFYVISNTGKIGGAAGPDVENQDTMLCIVDGSAAGNHADVGENWILGQVNTDMDLEGVIRDHLADKDIVRLKGAIDASVEPAPDYPDASAGDMWIIEKAGRIGGSSGPRVEKNDSIMCLSDSSPTGDHATVGTNWMIGQVSTDLDLGTAFASYLKIDKLAHGWTNDDVGKMVIKTVGAGGVGDFTTASADDVETAEVVGHISKIDSSDQFTINRIGHLYRSTTEWDALCGTSGGLGEGDVYFLNTSGGTFYTKDISHLLPGNIDMPAFIALSATDVWYYGYRGAEVGGGTSFGKSFAATDFSGNVMTVTHGLNTKRPIIRVFDENDQPVEAIQSRPTTGNELNAQDITFSDEMIAEMSSTLWHVIVIGTGVPYTTTEIEIPDYEPVAQQHGVKILPNGAVYSFDDWNGVEGFLSGDHAFVVPYKQSLSNVFTGFEVVGFESFGNQRTIKSFIGLQWGKGRDSVTNNTVVDFLRGGNAFWIADGTQAQIIEFGGNSIHYDKYTEEFTISKSGSWGGTAGDSQIMWNWHYPMARVWHAPGASSRKVPTPWGMVDSVESNPSSGLTGDQVVTELYNPLTGNGCLLYIGTGVARTLDISGGIGPQWMIVKNLSSTYGGIVYHEMLNGGVTPEQWHIFLDNAAVELSASGPWNNTAPTSSSISFGTRSETNESESLIIAYYFAPVAGLQNFGGYSGNSGVNNQITGCKDGMSFIKCRSGIASRCWNVYDSFRGDTKVLRWDLIDAEITYPGIGFNSDSGIELNSSDSDLNSTGGEYIYGHFGNQLIPHGNFNVYPSDPILANSSNNKVTIIFEYKGGAILNSELLVYATREPSPNWVQGTLTKLTDLADGYQLLSAVIDISGNANNTHMRWRLASNESTKTEHNIKNLKITWS